MSPEDIFTTWDILKQGNQMLLLPSSTISAMLLSLFSRGALRYVPNLPMCHYDDDSTPENMFLLQEKSYIYSCWEGVCRTQFIC